MKHFTHEFSEILRTLEEKTPLSDKKELDVHLFLLEIDIAIDGLVELAQFHKHQQKRWNDEAESLCIYRNMIREKKGELRGKSNERAEP